MMSLNSSSIRMGCRGVDQCWGMGLRILGLPLMFILLLSLGNQYRMSFLFSMFSKTGKQELGKYDHISFKINLSDHIPQYYEATSNKAIVQAELTPEHPLYYEIFPREQQRPDQNYIQYLVKDNDTMSGLAIRLDISEQYLRNINGISGSLYPNMIIKLPKDTDLSKLEEPEVVEQVERLRISQLLTTEKPSNNVNYKFLVYYFAGPSGDIKGTLTLNNNYIIFNPLLEDPENVTRFTVQKLLKFNVLLEVGDIQKAEYMRIPQIQQYSEGDPKFNNIVQFMLYKVGNVKIQKKYKERLKQLKIDNKAIASISFSFKAQPEEEAQKQATTVTEIINSITQSQKQIEDDDENKKRLTNIPFFDIINQKCIESAKSISAISSANHIITKTAIFGILTEQSSILTPEHFDNLVKKFPLLYKLYNWQKVFAARRDGSAFNTFLTKTKNVQPAIFLIKQYKGNIIGAFLVESLEAGKTGRGEMFIFTFRGESKVPEVYEWTTKNDFFVYLEKDQGIGIGMGVKYGLFISRNFEKGSSAPSNTFGNKEPLSTKQDFHIDDIEVWGVDNTF